MEPNWLSIETAPSLDDATQTVILFTDGQTVYTGHRLSSTSTSCLNLQERCYSATHWMPLPELPVVNHSYEQLTREDYMFLDVLLTVNAGKLQLDTKEAVSNYCRILDIIRANI